MSYLDFPGNLLAQQVASSKVVYTAICPDPPLAWPDPALVRQAANLIMTAKRPLVIVGKGNTHTRITVPIMCGQLSLSYGKKSYLSMCPYMHMYMWLSSPVTFLIYW